MFFSGKQLINSLLGGRILGVVTRPDPFSAEHFAHPKRLGKPMPGAPSVYYLENVGQSDEGEYVQFPTAGTAPATDVPLVQDIWKVLGTIPT